MQPKFITFYFETIRCCYNLVWLVQVQSKFLHGWAISGEITMNPHFLLIGHVIKLENKTFDHVSRAPLG